MDSIRFWINNKEIEASPDQTILAAAEQSGIVIPRLCYHPVVKASGSCRLCAVQIEGYRGLPAACSTPVSEGMRVQTSTPKVEELRREMLRIILQEHPRECLGCPRDGTCELQQLVATIGIDFPYPAPGGARPPLKFGGAYFERDYALCVRCGRCVRVCHEVRGAKAIVFREIEGRQEVSTPFDRRLEEVGCQFCGACVDVCPVGALRERLEPYQGEARSQMLQICENLTDIVINLYRKELPRRWKSTICPICSAGCRMMFELSESEEIIQAKPHPTAPANGGQACVQGRFLLKSYLQRPDRLKLPKIREEGGMREAGWDEALDFVASKLKGYGPGQVAVLSDARAANEELYLLQKFARSVLKSDLVGCITPAGHMQCSEVLRYNLGVVGATGSLEDLDKAGCIFAIGLNPAASHPIAGTRLRRAVLNGARLVAASPYKVAVARYADLHLSYYPGSEPALIAGIVKMLLDAKSIDSAFADKYSYAIGDLKRSLTPYHLDYVSKTTGVHAETLAEAACIIGEAATVSILYGLGLIQADEAPQALQGLVTLAHIKGSFGKPGCGIAPLYGNGNLQGAWDMGMAPHLLPGQVARSGSANTTEILEELGSGKIKALCLAMENLESASLEFLQPYLERLDFVVIHDVREPQVRADVVLPMAATAEKRGSLTNAERRVQSFEPVLTPPGEARSIQMVLQALAVRMGASGFFYENVEAVWSEIRRAVPDYGGISSGGKSTQWPCRDEGSDGTCTLFVDRRPDWRGWKPILPIIGEDRVNEEFPLALLSKESLQPFFAGPVLAPEVRSIVESDGKIEMNPADLFGMGLSPGDFIRVITASGECRGQLAVNELLPEKVVAAPLEAIQSSLNVADVNGKVLPARVEIAEENR